MNVIHRSIMIPIDALKPHPDNPRKDVGDVAELAESIKANGVFQNLTVLKGDILDGYTVIIGHRRLAAARAAGLTELPCMVVEMDEREQISTMLLENMQRNDLTVYEQAQGFQMMLDLGETESDIAEKTGFSKTTIKHRLKLLELDPEEFRKSQERQPSMADYIELEKISDPKLKNNALKVIGTSNFDWTVRSAINEEKSRKNASAWYEFLPMVAEKVSSSARSKYRYLKYCYAGEELTAKLKKEIKSLTDTKLRYCCEGRNIYFLGEKTEEEKEEKISAEQEERNRKIREGERYIEKIEKQAAESRKEFVKQFSSRVHMSKLVTALLTDPFLDEIVYEEVADMLGIDFNFEEESFRDFFKSEDYKDAADYCQHQVILAMLYTIYDGEENFISLYDSYHKVYRRSEALEHWYDILKSVGYKMSSEEKALLDGSHECFKEVEDANSQT